MYVQSGSPSTKINDGVITWAKLHPVVKAIIEVGV